MKNILSNNNKDKPFYIYMKINYLLFCVFSFPVSN